MDNYSLYQNALKLFYDTFIKSEMCVDVFLEYPKSSDFDKLEICSDEESETIKSNIKIILSGHNQELFPMELGDNSDDFIEFSVFENDDTKDEQKVKESRFIIYNNEKYIVKKVFISSIGGSVFLKDCLARRERWLLEILKRDPLLLAYKAVQKAVKKVNGNNFIVRDAYPNPSEAKKSVPMACIQVVSGSTKKSIMSDYETHDMKKLPDGKWLVCRENLRFYYLLKVTFFDEKLNNVQKLSSDFLAFIEKSENYIDLPDDNWNEKMLIYIEEPPLPPSGEQNLYKVEQSWRCRGKLLIDEVVPSIDVSKIKFKVQNF